MPIVRINQHLVYFAHVPKCAGTAVERYLGERFGDLALLDRDYFSQQPRKRWSKTSPQHILTDALDRMFPPRFFHASFSIVRHPVDRLISLYRYQRDVLKEIDAGVGFSGWLNSLAETRQTKVFYMDNHAQPMSAFVPADARVFKLEHGMRAVTDWLDGFSGGSDDRFCIGERNTYEQRLKIGKLAAGPAPDVSAADRALIGDLYAEDFERFDYELEI